MWQVLRFSASGRSAIHIDAFDFDLPEELIALRPVSPRRAARLLVQDGAATHLAEMADLGMFLDPGDVLVFNNTKVIPARLSGRRIRGDADAAIELTLIAETEEGGWRALARPARKLQPGDQITFAGGLECTVEARETGGAVRIRFNQAGNAFWFALEQAGVMPLPPYIASRRAPDAADAAQYQTIFAKRPGAIAAPTASLHFDDVLIGDLAARGIESTFVTLHVGLGTFQPVQVENIADHKMHAEWGEVSEAAAAAVNRARQSGKRIIPVGTTALRLIETAATADGPSGPLAG